MFDWPIAILETEWRKNYRMIYRNLSGKERKHRKQAGIRFCSQNHERVIWLFICCFCCSFVIISRPTKTSFKEIECLKSKTKAIALTNHNRRNHSMIQSEFEVICMKPAQSAEERVKIATTSYSFASRWLKVARVLPVNQCNHRAR